MRLCGNHAMLDLERTMLVFRSILLLSGIRACIRAYSSGTLVLVSHIPRVLTLPLNPNPNPPLGYLRGR